MPWKVPMEEKTRFVLQAESGMYTMSELCAWYEISRKTGYKWLRRYRESGLEGLREMSRRHHSHPHKTAKELEAAIIDVRMRHERWGPRKLHRILQREHPDIAWPVFFRFALSLRYLSAQYDWSNFKASHPQVTKW